jgi:hypothetical protein
MPHPHHATDFKHHQRGNQQTERRITSEALAHLRQVHVQHHHNEQEQHHDRADIDQHQHDGEKLRFQQQPQYGAIEESKYQKQCGVYRVAGRNDADRGHHQHAGKCVKQNFVNTHG